MNTCKPIFRMLALLAIASGSLNGQTSVSGLISSNITWTFTGSPYVVTGNTLVNNGVRLTIEPGVVVKFDSTTTLQINGELLAIGTAQKRITFTATNPTPVKGSWGRIQFSHTSTDAVFDPLGNYLSGSIMKYCDIRYGGGVTGDTVTVFCDTAAPYFSHCRISDSKKHGVQFIGAVGRVESSSFRNCRGSALIYTKPVYADLMIANDTLEDNGGGIMSVGTGPIASLIADLTIQNCIFTRTGNVIIVGTRSANAIIENNSFTSNKHALYLNADGISIISDNVFTACDNAEVLSGDLGRKATISNNVFVDNNEGVLGGTFCGPTDGSTLGADTMFIMNNLFENNQGAIHLGSDGLWAVVNFSVIQDNVFRNNRFQGSCLFFNQQMLVGIRTGQQFIINNVFEGNTNASGTGALVFSSGEIANNLIKNNSPGTIAPSLSGGDAIICSNKFYNNSGTVYDYTYPSPGGPIIHHNVFENNSVGDVAISVNGDATITNNEFSGNTPASSVISIIGGSPAVSNNKFFNNVVDSGSVVTISESTAEIRNNDFLGNNGVSCLQISGTTVQPVVAQNNLANPGIQYELENLIPFVAFDLSIPDNYWGTSSTAHIDSAIKDFFDDGNLSIAFYAPVLASPAPIDTAALCVTGTTVTVSGAIVTETGMPVPGVTITLSGNDFQTYTTDTTGRYDFSVAQGGSFTITPSKSNDVVTNNGITSVDVLLMRRHILGNGALGSPYKIIAAAECNAAGDTLVSTADILLTRQLILGQSTSFPTNRLWQFIPSDYVFPDVTNPFPFPTTRTYTNITTNQTGQDFIGIKLGDVNGSWDAGTP